MSRAVPFPHPRVSAPLHAFQQGAALHAQGRLAEAEQLYEIVLQAEPRHFDTLCRVGVIRLQQSRFDEAAALFRRALKANKRSPEAHQYLAFALTGLERLEEAVRHYEHALAIRPGFAEAHNNCGHALQRLGRMEQAIARYEKALALSPAYAEAHNNLANTLHLLDRHEEALPHYEKAVAIRPDYAEALWNMANALKHMGRLEAAVASYEKALAVRPNYAEAHNSLANTLRQLGRAEDAVTHYQKALAINPAYADACLNLGTTLSALGRHDEAIAQFDKALAIRPRDSRSLSKRGIALEKLRRLEEALANFEMALAIEPENIEAFNGLAGYAKAACDWSRTEKVSGELLDRVAAGDPVEPFTLLGYTGDPALQLACAREFSRNLFPPDPPQLWTGAVWQNPKIRIAYFAAGFHKHPMAYLTAELFETHDRSRFEVLGISVGPDDRSDIRSRMVRAFDSFHDLRPYSDREAAKLLYDLKIDLIIDRSGYTQFARPQILACRPAPIQVNYLGFPGTLGTDFYDYLIADPIVLPFEQQRFVTEKVVHLPDCYQVNDTTRALAKTPAKHEVGLPESGFVFCCFNNNNKITSPIFDVWMRLLHRVDGSVLWLFKSNPIAERNLRKQAAARGIDPARLVFANKMELADHLARHRLADLFLDTLPYNAHTTATDALWAGLPLVTCKGEWFPGRVAASVLNAIGLPELVTHNLEEYEALAFRLATEPPLLRELREKLERNRSTHPLFDTDRLRRHIEAAYTKMWELWQRGEGPQSFAVEPLPPHPALAEVPGRRSGPGA